MDNKTPNVSIHISDRDHMNLTLNIYHCGNMDIPLSDERNVNYYMFYYVNQGCGTITFNKVCQKLQKGSIFTIFPNHTVTIKSQYNNNLNVTWIAFSGYQVEHYLSRGGITMNNPVVNFSDNTELEELFKNILGKAQVMPNRYCKITSYLYSVFAFLLDNWDKGNSLPSYSLEYYLVKSLDFIDIYYGGNLSVEQIADYVGISRKYLYYVFKKLTSFSPKEYLILYRIMKAVQFLEESNYNIGYISTIVGYTNQFGFSKEFKKVVGKTPTEYREDLNVNPITHYISPINKLEQQFVNDPSQHS